MAPQRFTDNQDGTITDAETGLTWTKEDSWQVDRQWLSWDEAETYVDTLRNMSFAKTQDWRLPTRTEISSLYDPDKNNKDKYGKEIHLDPIFPEGPLAKDWTFDYTGNEAYIIDFSTGEVEPLYKSKAARMAVRAVRSAGPKTTEEQGKDPFNEDRFLTSR